MKVNGIHYRSIWFDHAASEVKIIDQRRLPHEFRVAVLDTLEEFAVAIRDMWVRGAPLIGATAAYGVACEVARDASDASLERIRETLHATRPTAVNLRWALTRCAAALRPLPLSERPAAALALAHEIAEEDVETNRRIGVHGLELIRAAAAKKPAGAPVNILTHCNAGWPATVDWGTATSPMYHAHDAGIPIHIWVDETRPRNQGAMTAWELGSHGIPHTYITDNAGGHLMQHGEVDMVITGTDRTTAHGDVCNKIGTYLKALAAHDNGVPFYVGLPSPTIDWAAADGLADIPIEERPQREVTHIWGREDAPAAGRRGGSFDTPERNGSDQKGGAPFGTAARNDSEQKGGWAGKNKGGVGGLPPHGSISPGKGGDVEIGEVQVAPEGSPGGNPAFDVTPARLVTGLITERGISPASREGLASLFPEHAD